MPILDHYIVSLFRHILEESDKACALSLNLSVLRSSSLPNFLFCKSPLSSEKVEICGPTSPLKLEGGEATPNLPKIRRWVGPERGFVKTSGIWEIERTKEREMRPARYCCRTKWQSRSTCLVRSWTVDGGLAIREEGNWKRRSEREILK